MNPAAPVPTGDSDAPLVRRAREGDLEAFAALVERYQRPLTAKALGCLRQVQDADDLVQETFLRAWRGLGSFREDSRFGPWLYRILRNLVVDRSRKAWREIEGAEEIARRAADGAPTPEEEMMSRDLAAQVQKALDALPEGRQREIFRLRFQQGLPIAEIAGRLGIHPGTVKVHIFRTARRLRRRLEGLETQR
ncbi:MAG: RNA polymerase sigma factor [Acidobacteriota bacterium]|nr:RNA polymerase sigma factor [Acidobacteriota bacterium]